VNVRFLLDENLDPKVKVATLRLNPTVDVLRVGDQGVPLLSTADPDLLRFCEVAQRILVTADRIRVDSFLEHTTSSLRQRQQRWLNPQQYAGYPQRHPARHNEQHQRKRYQPPSTPPQAIEQRAQRQADQRRHEVQVAHQQP
jgi:hypothetical protein